jgi:hypothetical protein
VAVAAATALGVGLGPALADPPSGTVPALTSVVGVGAQTTQGLLDAIATSYNATKPANKLWSWDAINPKTGATGDTIVTKGSTLRPGLRPEGVALRAVRLTGRDEPGTFGVWLMTSAGGTGIC